MQDFIRRFINYKEKWSFVCCLSVFVYSVVTIIVGIKESNLQKNVIFIAAIFLFLTLYFIGKMYPEKTTWGPEIETEETEEEISEEDDYFEV